MTIWSGWSGQRQEFKLVMRASKCTHVRQKQELCKALKWSHCWETGTGRRSNFRKEIQKQAARTAGAQGQQQLLWIRSDLSVQEVSVIGSGHTKPAPSSKHEMEILYFHCREICIYLCLLRRINACYYTPNVVPL